MEFRPIFSILIANYNNGKFFQDCYNSIIGQSETYWEAVILDDCSTDDSVQIIKKLVGTDSRFKLFRNDKNEGIGFTKRRLIEESTTEICGFLDPDDALRPYALQKMLEAHETSPEVGLVYSNFIYCDKNLNEGKVHKTEQITTLDNKYLNLKGEISHFATLKKSIYNKTAGIDSYLKIAEDKDWYMKMCEVAPVKHVDENLYLYRVHTGGISTNQNIEKALFWHFVALIKMAERRNINIENLFFENFISKSKAESELKYEKNKIANLKNSRLLKLLYKFGLFKAYKYL